MTRRAIIVHGGWQGHQPLEISQLFIPFLEANDFEVTVHEGPEVYATDAMGSVDLVVQSITMGTATPEQVKGLVDAVKAGCGLAGWHGGIVDSFRESSDYQQMTGGQFVHHAVLDAEGTTSFVPYTMELTESGREHEITRDMPAFELTTELYWVLADEYNDVLTTVTQPQRDFDAWTKPVTFPAVWTRQWGQGRVFVATPGHHLPDFDSVELRELIQRGMLWAAR